MSPQFNEVRNILRETSSPSHMQLQNVHNIFFANLFVAKKHTHKTKKEKFRAIHLSVQGYFRAAHFLPDHYKG